MSEAKVEGQDKAVEYVPTAEERQRSLESLANQLGILEWESLEIGRRFKGLEDRFQQVQNEKSAIYSAMLKLQEMASEDESEAPEDGSDDSNPT